MIKFINFLMDLKDVSAGCIIFSEESVLIVKNKKISFSFPKGHIKKGESVFDCAKRELFEETGLFTEDLKFVKELGFVERPDGYSKRLKKVYYFLFYAYEEKKVSSRDTDNQAYWVKREKAEELLTHEEDRKLFRRISSFSF